MRMTKRMSKQRMLIRTLFMLLFLSFAVSPVLAWETPIIVDDKPGYSYYKPEIGFAPSGAVYIAYRQKDPGAGNSEIYVCYYDGEEMTYENVSQSYTLWPNYKSYESDIEVTADGIVHVAWTAHNRAVPDIHYVKYRYLDGNTWSDIVNLGTLHMHPGDGAIDLRLGVDNSGNVHVIVQEEEQTIIRYFAKYGDTIMPMDTIGNPGSRLKHPDIAVDDNYVHMIWMRKVGYPYVIMYQKRENSMNGTKGEIRQITFPRGDFASQKSRIDVDSDGYFHLAEFYKTGVVKKLKYYKELPDGSLTPYVNLSHPDNLMLYHWAGLEVRDNSIIASMQLGSSSGGSGLFYNWQRNGEWGGYSAIPGTYGAVHQSVDLSADGETAAISYGRYSNAIMLVSSAPITATGSLETEFTHPDTVFWGSDITFDASQCANLNPDYNITNYLWDFGDGTIENTNSPTITHRFQTYGQEVDVTLEITAETGETGIYNTTIYIHALYNGIITSVTSRRIRTLFYDRPANDIQWTPNPGNTNAGYPDITSYQIWRAPQSTTFSEDDYENVGEVESNVNEFLDYYGVQENVHYIYSIRSVDAEGHISPFNNQSAPGNAVTDQVKDIDTGRMY